MEIINVVDVINIVAKERKNHLIKHFDGLKLRTIDKEHYSE
jgi:hypothetical protein